MTIQFETSLIMLLITYVYKIFFCMIFSYLYKNLASEVNQKGFGQTQSLHIVQIPINMILLKERNMQIEIDDEGVESDEEELPIVLDDECVEGDEEELPIVLDDEGVEGDVEELPIVLDDEGDDGDVEELPIVLDDEGVEGDEEELPIVLDDEGDDGDVEELPIVLDDEELVLHIINIVPKILIKIKIFIFLISKIKLNLCIIYVSLQEIFLLKSQILIYQTFNHFQNFTSIFYVKLQIFLKFDIKNRIAE
ncbi:interphotoreceptor matrix proteoglycan 2-like isoform X1 [Brachionus plicatilis]|uniref:Interphotoreceptor matrix proteoglycan 2-like isoform X1 n=1 Tax=Brachionus plicatilis TaxID=10195 RepID=A0A3M7PDM8_BRAPC|nr:interphotoreceptor matrix proteoglycan 2-like isoform X1 [Brachionus plicatilis]